MGLPNAGERPWKRLHVAAFAAALILASAPTGAAGAGDFTFTSKSYLLYFEREGGGTKQKFAPLYEYLSGDVHALGGTPLSFHFYGWGRVDLQDETDSGKTGGDIGSAYLQYNHPTGNAEMRLGRFFLAEGIAVETLDGLFLKARTPMGLGVSVYGGVPVEYAISGLAKGDSLFGGRLFFVRSGWVEIGATYLVEKGTFQGDDRKAVGGDLWIRPVRAFELSARASYNASTKGMAQQRYVARIMPAAAVDLSVGYEEYQYKDLFQTSLHPAFLSPSVDNNDRVKALFAVLDWELVKNLTVEAVVKNLRHDLAAPGSANRFEGGIRYAYNDRKDLAGLSAAVVTADRDENAYEEYRAFGSWSPGRWRLSLDLLADQYKQEISGAKSAYQAVGSAGYRVTGALQVSGDVTYTKSPRFDRDFAGLVRVSYRFTPATGGKK